MKICTKCKIEKDETEFYKDKRRVSGLRSECKSCSLEDNSNREHRYLGTRKEYRDNNKDKIKKIHRTYYINNREQILKTNSYYRTSLNYKFISYKNGAKRRGLEWQLTKEDFEEYWNKNCFYCNNEISTIGIDRIDSTKGYVKDNIKPCCSLCNTIKLDLTYNEFIGQIIKIYNNLELWKKS